MGIGLNPKCSFCGIMLEDEGVFGSVHIGIGTNITLRGKIQAACHYDLIMTKPIIKVNDETIWESSALERVDSTDGKVYRYFEDPSLSESEYVAYDLLAEVGDTTNSFRLGLNTVMFTTMYAEDSPESVI